MTASRADLRDLPGSCIRFGRLLRAHGMRVSPEQEVRWLRSLDLLGCREPEEFYWSGRLTLVSGRGQIPLYDDLFRQFWLTLDHVALDPRAAPTSDRAARTRDKQAAVTLPESGDPGASTRPTAKDGVGPGRGLPGMQAWLARVNPPAPDGAGGDDSPADTPPTHGLYSAAERLREKDFAAYTAADRTLLAALLQQGPRWWAPDLLSRRTAPAGAGPRIDLRRTLAAAARTGGEPMQLYHRRRRLRWRKWIFLCDISGSMAPYAQTLLLCLHAVLARRPGTEVFLFGTRLTRVTPQLRRSRSGQMADSLRNVHDWHGGTRLGSALRTFARQYGQRGLAHGAFLVVLSDGLDQGDVSEVGAQMQRLRRVAHRIAWVNPLKRSPQYEPLARAMAAALPYIDDFVSGHNLAGLVDLLSRRDQPARCNRSPGRDLP